MSYRSRELTSVFIFSSFIISGTAILSLGLGIMTLFIGCAIIFLSIPFTFFRG